MSDLVAWISTVTGYEPDLLNHSTHIRSINYQHTKMSQPPKKCEDNDCRNVAEHTSVIEYFCGEHREAHIISGH